jgi:cytoskeletal protein CcmA (bactofilin family)
MFGKGKKTSCSRIDTVIGEQTRLEGDIHFAGGLHVDGTVKGNIIAEPDSENVLTVSEKGRIEGDVQVPNLVLNGAVEGDVHASERVELASHAKVTGNVYYNLIEMAIGAEVNGNLVHRGAGHHEPEPGESINDIDAAGMTPAK